MDAPLPRRAVLAAAAGTGAGLLVPTAVHAVDDPRPVLRLVLPGIRPAPRAASGRPVAHDRDSYFPALLRLALERTRATDGPYALDYFGVAMTNPRQMAELQHRRSITVMWDGTDHRREAELLAVGVSLLKSLNDHRVLMIRREDQPRFREMRTLDDLRALKAGVGVNWPSGAVLRANGLTVVEALDYESLFPMLRGRRFDYLPRGAWEAWAEEREHVAQGLVVEQTMFLHYVLPFHFFVHRDDTALADRLERGLALAQADGSFDRLLESVPSFRRGLDEIRANRRRVFELRLP